MLGHLNARLLLAARVALALVALLVSQPSHSAEAVDVELVLAVDVSLPITPAELETQRRGYAAALSHDHVLQAIAAGRHGKIAVTYFEWAATNMQHVVVPWTVIASKADAQRVAAQLTANRPFSGQPTSISAALKFGADLFRKSGFRASKRIIDISGGGPNNDGAPITGVRNAVIKRGITINALPFTTNSASEAAYNMSRVDRYYADCVIGGPGSFMMPVSDWRQFAAVLRRKLVLELAGPSSSAWRAEAGDEGLPVELATAYAPSDCMIGERLWRN